MKPQSTTAPAAGGTEGNPPARKGIARVHIYGGGIAGLTAAHELALRGFRVRVIEPAQECDETGQLEGLPLPVERRMAVGGLARTQFLRVNWGARGNFAPESDSTPESNRAFLPYRPDFDAGEGTSNVPTNVLELVQKFLRDCGFFNRGEGQGVLHVRLPSGVDEGQEAGQRLRRNAQALHRYMTTDPYPGVLKLDPERVILLDREEARELEADLKAMEPLPPPAGGTGLWLELVHFLPGEHGFRFFPSYYRHLFATMMDTPILDENNRLTGRTVYDNLVPSSFYGIAAQGRRIRFLRRAPPSRPVEMLQELRDLADSGYPATDTAQFTLRLWRYMSTCSERRKAEYEKLSWWEYLEGYDAKANTRRYQYSDAFKRDMQFAPRVLAAFDSTWGDARTNGNTLVQLYLNNLLPLPKTDGTLNGPTTVAWFRPWRRYLREYLKVEFYAGKLTRLLFDKKGRLTPYWQAKNALKDVPDAVVYDSSVGTPKVEPPATEDVDYYIIATDAATAETVTQNLEPIGVIEKLRGFTSKVPVRPRETGEPQERVKDAFPGQVPWDRFQTLTGIQFFFPAAFRLAEGYIYFLDAPWGLSAINSQQYWAVPPTFDRNGYGAVLSVDIGNWFLEGQTSPADCSRDELAHAVWEQIRQATELHGLPLPNAAPYDFALPAPAWYTLDRFIGFETDPTTRVERPKRNLAPYLIPIMGDWDNRPGTEPWDPLRPPPPPAQMPLSAALWQAAHGGYPVHWNKLVFAGTYLKTFTRMTTMEAANESARHAVNAIIDHYLFKHDLVPHPAPPAPVRNRILPLLGDREVIKDTPEFRMTPIGEYCHIWDPEQNELAELAPLRELDAKLYAMNMPHVWDVLRLEPLAMPFIPSPGTPGGMEPLLELLRKVREGLEKLLEGIPTGTKQTLW
ncbi:NAD(P)-binding protein [Pyxidicoccus parkwayensis]|uniref:NAD(P)-binding protein n=1 Tax=Pyxidicoccus parkwayensis TaxID=2813578 RepID=A0ABX7P120_9BACT|nr:FAD/NAD(P)-binding protein [Pyxidicoccus parkwaysis]QSQ23446.1 NAD(P)-binding protein [Pyxidicoccus parkwaysis]